ncbi:pyridoxal phosphate-dependent aminotransferase [Acuticoccus kandeliae]|uniref:pyridoxal phosphate-dependent aminotransferase n=1 Tax=Acuticoccus kandeliae TaxID=2073160 RepID=UPI001FE6C04C|nr:pyridoxal phosphate-dependent aminotransferase [Acuticoccus kandeliae]
MNQSAARNRHFDRLVNTEGLKWLGQNTNHYPVHPSVKAAMIACLDKEEFHAYAPPLGLEALRAGIVADLGLDGMEAMVTDGAVSGLYHVCHTFCRPGDRFVTTDPTWAWPMSFARSVGAEVVQLPIYGDEYGFRLDPERLRAAVDERTRMIYIVDPNNPIGSTQTAEEIEAIAEIARSVDAVLVHDCTYRDFAYDHHLAARHYPEKTITTWSFSKWLGLAGLRVGALVAAPDMIETLAAAPPNNLGSSILAQRGALAGLAAKAEWFPAVLESQRANQRLVKEAFDALPGFRLPVFPSSGNFLVIETVEAGIRPEALCAVMARHGVMIRQGSYHTKTFGDRFIKVSVTVPTEWVETFCRLLPEAVEEARGLNEEIALF